MRRALSYALITGSLFTLAACSSSTSVSSTSTPAQALAPQVESTGAVVIDVRTPSEFGSGHLNGALNIDVQAADFVAQVGSLDPAGRYLVYCRSGNRSAAAIDIMRSLGFTNLTDLGSVAEASEATGIPVV